VAEKREYLRYKTYWIIFVAGIVAWILIGFAIGSSFGVNSYVSGSLAGGGCVLWETWQVAGRG
jgi:hypothetical protein